MLNIFCFTYLLSFFTKHLQNLLRFKKTVKEIVIKWFYIIYRNFHHKHIFKKIQVRVPYLFLNGRKSFFLLKALLSTKFNNWFHKQCVASSIKPNHWQHRVPFYYFFFTRNIQKRSEVFIKYFHLRKRIMFFREKNKEEVATKENMNMRRGWFVQKVNCHLRTPL